MAKRILDFEATFECTHNCMYCYNAWKKDASVMPKHLDTNSTLKMLEKAINEINPVRVVFSGGEPFMRPDLPQLIRYVHSLNLPMTIFSNGALLEEKDFDFCRQNGVDLFEIPLLAPDKVLHDELARPMADFSAFDNAVWATQKALKKGFSVSHIFVATHKNLPVLADTMKLSYALGVRDFLLNRFNAGGEGFKHLEKLQITPLEMAAGLKTANDFALHHPTFKVSCAVNIHPCLVDLSRYNLVKMTGCGVGKDQRLYVLDPVGNIRLCNFSSVNIGNILNNSFDEIINSTVALDYISAHPKLCDGCKKLPLCQGGCKASADNCFGSPCLPDDWLRRYQKGLYQG